MASGDFYTADPLEQVAINLFYGWGYNFYRIENQLRADDLLVRAKACGLLGDARAVVGAAESIYRRTSIAAPSRAKPFPDARWSRTRGRWSGLRARSARWRDRCVLNPRRRLTA